MQIQSIVYYRMSSERRTICTAEGGTYFPSRTSAQCIKDGRIVTIWTLTGGRNDNP